MFDTEVNDTQKDTIESVQHSSVYNTDALNSAIEKANRDPNFIIKSVQILNKMEFPSYKDNILSYVKRSTNNSEVLSLFESLDGYIEYKDQYHVLKALEENSSGKKITNQISESTRLHPEVRTRSKTADQRIKDSEAVKKSEERGDYPEVPPSAMSNFLCDKCGKIFQNQYVLLQHERFDG
ncbi:MAG: hypothetical protein M3297_16770 [Thermoproteota archaeon]|nr:hypothetical protein [Thermoproteota archaeon]